MKWVLRLLLLTVLIIAFVGMEAFWTEMRVIKLKNNMGSLRQIREACAAYASIHEGHYPDGTTSNEALRQLFISGLIDDEALFSTSGLDRMSTDRNIGTAENGYLQALAPGECRLNYIRGLTAGKTDPTIPLIYMQFAGDDGEVWMLSYTEGGERAEDRTTNGAVLQEQNGQQVDIFSEAYLKEKYGIDPKDILKPEGPARDVIAIARARKWENRRFEATIIAIICAPFLLSRLLRPRPKANTPPEMPAP